MTNSTASLVQIANILKKVYFPRLIIHAASVMARLVDFGIAMLLVFGLTMWFGTRPTVCALALPLLALLTVLVSAGIWMRLTAMAVQFRDVNYGTVFAVQLLIHIAGGLTGERSPRGSSAGLWPQPHDWRHLGLSLGTARKDPDALGPSGHGVLRRYRHSYYRRPLLPPNGTRFRGRSLSSNV